MQPTTFLSNRSEFSFIWGWGCHSPLGGRKREFVWKWPGTTVEKEMESDVVVISLPVSLNPSVPESLSFLTMWDVSFFFFFLKPLWHKFVSLCIHKRESWLTTVFLTSLSGTVSWCGPPTCDLRSHLNPLTPWNYSSYFHLCFCICFGTTNMVRTICHLTGFKGFSQVLYHITSTLQMRKLRIRELKRPCDQGHTVNRLWSPAQSFWLSGVCSFIHTCRRQWRGLRRCREYPPLVNKILCLLYPTFPSCSLLACPHSPNLLFGAAVCPTSAQ